MISGEVKVGERVRVSLPHSPDMVVTGLSSASYCHCGYFDQQGEYHEASFPVQALESREWYYASMCGLKAV